MTDEKILTMAHVLRLSVKKEDESKLVTLVKSALMFEREECAKVCETEADKSVADQEAGGMYYCAAAIRSRTNPVK